MIPGGKTVVMTARHSVSGDMTSTEDAVKNMFTINGLAAYNPDAPVSGVRLLTETKDQLQCENGDNIMWKG